MVIKNEIRNKIEEELEQSPIDFNNTYELLEGYYEVNGMKCYGVVVLNMKGSALCPVKFFTTYDDGRIEELDFRVRDRDPKFDLLHIGGINTGDYCAFSLDFHFLNNTKHLILAGNISDIVYYDVFDTFIEKFEVRGTLCDVYTPSLSVNDFILPYTTTNIVVSNRTNINGLDEFLNDNKGRWIEMREPG